MSDKPAKPAEHDPDATVMMTPGALKRPDPDATVMMTPGALKDPGEQHDPDATVMMPAGLGKEPPRVPLAAFQRDDDPDATVLGAPPPPEPEPAPVPAARELATPVTAESSKVPLIAGGLVVLAVALYFAFGGGKAPSPAAPKPEAAAPAAASASDPAPAAAPVVSTTPAPAPGAKAVALKDLLAGAVKGGKVVLGDENGATAITLRHSNQFASGGVDLDPKLHADVLAIAAALDKVPGAIVVTGHADAKPSTNAKFPSNDALSAARGESVARLLAGKLKDPKRVSSAGAGDKQQVAPSDTAENRAKNRRVVIVLKTAP